MQSYVDNWNLIRRVQVGAIYETENRVCVLIDQYALLVHSSISS